MTQSLLLERIGLTPPESAVYTSLVRQGISSPSDLVRDTKIHRPSVYGALKNLIDKGIVYVSVKGKQKRYAATKPEKIRQLLEQVNTDIEKELETLEKHYVNPGEKPIVTYGEGTNAISEVYSDVVHSLKRGDIYYRYSSNKELTRGRYVPKDYRQVRDQKQLERFVITNESTKKHHSNSLGRLIKAVPTDFDLFDYDISQIIYGNKVAIIDYNTTTAITIENAVFAEFQKKLFKLLFKKLS